MAPGVSFAGFDPVEADARTVDWSTLRRLILQGGRFPPVYQPVTEGELAASARGSHGPGHDRHGQGLRRRSTSWTGSVSSWTGTAQGAGALALHGCDCKVHPPQVRISGRVLAGFTDLGDPLFGEAGLAWSPGWNAAFEPVVDFSAGPWWVALSARLTGRVATAGVRFDGPGGPIGSP